MNLFSKRTSTPLSMFTLLFAASFLAGCKSEQPKPMSHTLQAAVYPARPNVPPPAFKVFHHDESSFTLVTPEDATDTQIEALIWQLHDAARAHSFVTLKIDQKAVDARDPMMWFHIYRGAKCASEKYTSAKLPCGASYHAAGDYTFGGFKDPQHDEGVLLHDEDHTVELWNPDPAVSSAPLTKS